MYALRNDVATTGPKLWPRVRNVAFIPFWMPVSSRRDERTMMFVIAMKHMITPQRTGIVVNTITGSPPAKARVSVVVAARATPPTMTRPEPASITGLGPILGIDRPTKGATMSIVTDVGTLRSPDKRTESPSPTKGIWMRTEFVTKTRNIDAPAITPTALLIQMFRWRSRAKSTTGFGTRGSQSRKAMVSARARRRSSGTPNATPPSVTPAQSPQPQYGPSEIAVRRLPRAPPRKSDPGMSRRCRSRTGDSRRRTTVRITRPMAKGITVWYVVRHPKSWVIAAPPRSPIVAPAANIAEMIPWAVPTRFGGNASPIMAKASGNIAIPTPWTPRTPIRR